MKKTYFGLLIALGITVGACQQDEATVTTEKQQHQKLKQTN